MKDEIVQKLQAVIGALNCISVSGKQNLANLSGSISLLEDIAGTLQGLEICPCKDENHEEP